MRDAFTLSKTLKPNGKILSMRKLYLISPTIPKSKPSCFNYVSCSSRLFLNLGYWYPFFWLGTRKNSPLAQISPTWTSLTLLSQRRLFKQLCRPLCWQAVVVPAWKQDFDSWIHLRKRHRVFKLDAKHSSFKGEVPRQLSRMRIPENCEEAEQIICLEDFHISSFKHRNRKTGTELGSSQSPLGAVFWSNAS